MMANSIKKIDQQLNNISDLSKNIKKGNPSITELRKNLSEIKQMMLQVLEEDERRKSTVNNKRY